jgi:hypothetical protein
VLTTRYTTPAEIVAEAHERHTRRLRTPVGGFLLAVAGVVIVFAAQGLRVEALEYVGGLLAVVGISGGVLGVAYVLIAGAADAITFRRRCGNRGTTPEGE